MAYTQTNRRIAIDTPLGEDAVLLRGFRGSESLSQLFHFNLELLSENESLSFQDIVGKEVSVMVQDADGEDRYWHGFISRFSQGHQDGKLTTYHAQMVPWLWFLTRTSDCRIFQNKKVPEIIQKVFKDLGFSDFELHLYGDFAPREYCVQYRETDFNFVSRLMEEEGIYYFFKQTKDKHLLILANDPAAHEAVPKQAQVRFASQDAAAYEEVITQWRYQEEFRPGTWTQTDYNFETPSTDLKVAVNGKNPYEIYEFPGQYSSRAEGDRLAKIRLQEQAAPATVSKGTSVCGHFSAGFKFELQDHYRQDQNQEYLLTRVSHSATQGGGYTVGGAAAEETSYSNTFECMPFSTPFRPQRVTPEPVVQGCQTAMVVGPAGQEIYTDTHGRVKVQFHWDREGQKNENSSCWIRVSHPWAGKGWGSVSIPRIGQEVIVDFLEGNPDQPIIVGRVYNGESMPPNGLPAAAMVSGIKSNSTPGGGGSNEISMNDTKGKEMMTVHAQYDMNTTVKHDDTQTVETGNRTITVAAGKHTEKIKGDTAITIETGNHSLDVQTGTHAETIKGNTSVTVLTGNHSLDVQTGTHTETIKGNTSVTVLAGAYLLDVQANTYTHHANGVVSENYDADQTTIVKGTVTIQSNTEIVLLCGASSLSMLPDGTIKLSGVDLNISGKSSAQVGVGSQTVTIDKAQVAITGAGISSTTKGTHEITGSPVKIN